MPSVKKQIAKKNQAAAISQSSRPSLEQQCVNVLQTTLPRLCDEASVTSFHDIPLAGPVFSSLGVVSEAKDSYFDSTETSRGCAEVFFSQAIKYSQHLDLLRKNCTVEGPVRTPSCLAFMTATIKSEILDEPRQLCFVFLSGWENNEDRRKLKNRIRSSIRKARDDKINGHKFEFIDLPTKHFSDVSNQLNKILYPDSRRLMKPCAEKRLVTTVMHLTDKYSSNFQVTGVSNYALHPYPQEKQEDQEHKVKHPADSVSSIKRKIDGHMYFIPEIKACPECQQNKLAALLMMKHIQDEQSQRTTALDELLDVPPLVPRIRISKATNDFISANADSESIKSIRVTKTDVALSTSSSTAPSSINSRSRASSFLSEASSSIVAFVNDEQLLLELEQD